MKTDQRGFTLIELLIVVAIIGILAMIAIPNLLDALQKARQKRTMADMRSIATSWEMRATEHNRYNAAGALSVLDICAEPIAFSALSGALIPTYTKTLPQRDGWDNPFRFRTDQPMGAPESANDYLIWSSGKNGMRDGSAGFDADSSHPGGGTTNFNEDLIFSRGIFLLYPEGVQTQ